MLERRPVFVYIILAWYSFWTILDAVDLDWASLDLSWMLAIAAGHLLVIFGCLLLFLRHNLTPMVFGGGLFLLYITSIAYILKLRI